MTDLPVTSHDVAKLAGVSQPTVSRALTGRPGVAAETRSRVEAAARQLGYVPNLLGRNLSTRRTRVIGVVANELANPFFVQLVDPLHEYLKQAGYRLVLYTDREDESVDFAELMDGSLDGVVLTTTNLDSTLPLTLLQRGLPTVLVNRGNPQLPVDASTVDNELGARSVADLLADLGHTRIGAVMGYPTASTSSEREIGLRNQLRTHGLELDEKYVTHGLFTMESGRTSCREIFSRPGPPPTALFCGNDVLALGVLDEAKRLGLDVPGNLTVVGFDDIALASMRAFDLTTVHCDLARLAIDGAELLLERIARPEAGVRRTVQRPRMALRGTHAAPRS